MTPTILIAGVGNVFFRDDGFGSAVAQALSRRRLPPGVRVMDAGIRGLHLAYELLSPHDLLVLIDVLPRGGEPGTLYVFAPDPGDASGVPDAHGMDPATMLATVRRMGGTLPPVRIVGCEPSDVSDGIGLTPPVESAVAAAAELALDLVDREIEMLTAAKDAANTREVGE